MGALMIPKSRMSGILNEIDNNVRLGFNEFSGAEFF